MREDRETVSVGDSEPEPEPEPEAAAQAEAEPEPEPTESTSRRRLSMSFGGDTSSRRVLRRICGTPGFVEKLQTELARHVAGQLMRSPDALQEVLDALN